MFKETNAAPLSGTGMQMTPPQLPNSSPSPQHTCDVAGVTTAVPGLHLSHSNSYPTLLLHAEAYLPIRYTAAVGQVLTGILFPSQKSLACSIPLPLSSAFIAGPSCRNAMGSEEIVTPCIFCVHTCLPFVRLQQLSKY